MTNGLYRRALGGEIVHASYDYTTGTIGPYTIPTYIHPPEHNNPDNFAMYRYYEVLLGDNEALAVFNNGNYCFAIIRRDMVYMVPYQRVVTRAFADQYTKFKLDPPIQSPVYKHIGYIRTHQECKAVAQLPYFLLQREDTGETPDIQDKVSGTPLVNPQLSLYKLLLDTDYKAVYYDLDTCQPVFLN